MKRAIIIDIIQSTSGSSIEVGSQMGYSQTIAIGSLGPDSFITKDILLATVAPTPFVYNLPAGSETPIIIDFTADTVKIGGASPVSIGSDLSIYQANPQILFEIITSPNNTTPKDSAAWIVNKEWHDNTYTVLDVLEISPEPDPLDPTVTADNINIIIKA